MNKLELEKFTQHLRLRGLSKSTIKSYLYYNKNFLKLANKSPREVGSDDIKNYLEKLVTKDNASTSTMNSAYSALKSYYSLLYKRKFFVDLPRAKKAKKLPVVLSKNEIGKMLKLTKNAKHKCIIAMLYGCGLRISEIIKLRIKDLCLEREVILVRAAKGKKDRYVAMPKKLIDDLAMQVGSKNMGEYLFSGRLCSRCLSTMGVYKIVKQAVKRAGIKKDVSPHTLRHSFATHLLEGGVSIRYIQKLLGHTRLETTQIYTKVASNNLNEISSPLDSLV